MATTPRLRAPRLRVSAFGITLAAFAAVLVPTGIGAAAPTSHLTLTQVKAQIAALDAKAERITESYNAARDRLAELQRKARLTQSELARDQVQLTNSQRKLAAQAAAAYRGGGLDATMSLVTSGTPQTFLDQTSALQEVAHFQATQVAAAAAAQRTLSADRILHSAQVKQQQATLAAITSQRNAINNLIAQQKSLLGRLTSAARAQYNAAANAVAAHQLALRSSYTGPASGQAAAAVQYAYAQLGKPYYYGGAGPNSFDCSGLTMRAWEAAGVSLPHNAAAQQSEIPAVSLGALEPGDLVFFGNPAYHVGIYIGGGRFIQAPHTGTVVQETSLSSYPPTSAGRP
ncbi:MAG TPA: NlpC/P60 family protein [Mycobacteriales bacterium]|nr:NlpC/P60 family protein [Mycobacteriales bacterium]